MTHRRRTEIIFSILALLPFQLALFFFSKTLFIAKYSPIIFISESLLLIALFVFSFILLRWKVAVVFFLGNILILVFLNWVSKRQLYSSTFADQFTSNYVKAYNELVIKKNNKVIYDMFGGQIHSKFENGKDVLIWSDGPDMLNNKAGLNCSREAFEVISNFFQRYNGSLQKAEKYLIKLVFWEIKKFRRIKGDIIFEANKKGMKMKGTNLTSTFIYKK